MEKQENQYQDEAAWLAANPLLQWREEQGIDGVALPMRKAADQIGGISYNTIMLWENGTFMPKYPNFIKMAEAMQFEGGADTLYKVWQQWREARPAETVTPVAV